MRDLLFDYWVIINFDVYIKFIRPPWRQESGYSWEVLNSQSPKYYKIYTIFNSFNEIEMPIILALLLATLTVAITETASASSGQ